MKSREKNLDSVHKYRQSSVVEVSVWQQKSLRNIQREAKRLTRVTKNEVFLFESGGGPQFFWQGKNDSMSLS